MTMDVMYKDETPGRSCLELGKGEVSNLENTKRDIKG
jgi:hypothetical protein